VDNWKWVSVKGQFLASTNSLVEKKLQHWLKDGIIKNHGPLGGMATSQVWSWIFFGNPSNMQMDDIIQC
jgi:hypothetical protein